MAERPHDPFPLPLLVTGITGVVGYHALAYFQSRCPGRVMGIRQVDDGRMAGPGIVACDAEDRDGIARLFDRHQFGSVLNCAGNCALKACELDPAMARRVNVDGIRNLLHETVAGGARLTHLSVDLVFGGRDGGNYTEDDPPDPVTMYGKTMVEAEQLVLDRDPAACVLRISLPMGLSLNGHAGAIDWISSRFRKNRPATLYYDEIRTPTYCDCLNRVCETMLAGRWHGLYHAGSPRPMSLFQIAQVINRVGGYDPRLLLGMPRHHAGPIPPRAGNVTMDSGKLCRALGADPFLPWPATERLRPLARDWHHHRPAGEMGSPEQVARLLAKRPDVELDQAVG